MITFKRQLHKLVKHTETFRQHKPASCWSVFDHFVGLELKGITAFALRFV